MEAPNPRKPPPIRHSPTPHSPNPSPETRPPHAPPSRIFPNSRRLLCLLQQIMNLTAASKNPRNHMKKKKKRSLLSKKHVRSQICDNCSSKPVSV
ncbi:hypothetical protein LINPERHAP1_LOCUS16453 [Linum perenne]